MTEVQTERSVPLEPPQAIRILRALIGVTWLVFQIYIIFYPQAPLLQRPLHLALALGLLLLWTPLSGSRLGIVGARVIDGLLLAGVAGTVIYYLLSASRLTERIEGIDEILSVDVGCGLLLIFLLLEGVRRAVGWSLLSVLIFFLIYGMTGNSFPGWLRFGGFDLNEGIEILTMTVNGVLGITTSTSLQFVFYFVMFGAVYSAIGGGQLFIDIGLKLAGRHKGGSAKAAVIASSLMGSISGSAVANVATTGVFTIPLMKRSGYSAPLAGAIEAIASTGGQLMPPIMGVAAFVVAEMLQVGYVDVALAGLIPALAFYLAVFLFVDLAARKSGTGVLSSEQLESHAGIWPRLYLLLPPITLVSVLLVGYSATFSAVVATASCVLVCYFKRETWMNIREWLDAIELGTRQAAQVAVPIAAIGMIIAVSIQSNLALKFSSQLIEGNGGTLYGAMLLIIVGCIIMGMGLPTVAAYIIGAILFVPALLKLGIPEMSAHFFVMYYCVLSMVTPPVALASYTAAGIAGGGVMRTSYQAFRLSLVSFFIPVRLCLRPAIIGGRTHSLGAGGLSVVNGGNRGLGGGAGRVPQQATELGGEGSVCRVVAGFDIFTNRDRFLGLGARWLGRYSAMGVVFIAFVGLGRGRGLASNLARLPSEAGHYLAGALELLADRRVIRFCMIQAPLPSG